MLLPVSKVWLILLVVIAFISAEVINFKVCEENDCNVDEVRVEPCPQATENVACHIKRRKPTKMSFDFTPNFPAETLDASLRWVKNTDQELPLITMDKEACKYTKCPVISGEKQTYSIDIPIESKFPSNFYTIKWNLKAANGKQCCFLHDIKLIR